MSLSCVIFQEYNAYNALIMKLLFTALSLFASISLCYAQDTTPPKVTLKKNNNLVLDASGNATLDPRQIDNGSTDNLTPAADLQFSLSKTNFDCSDIQVQGHWHSVGSEGFSEGFSYNNKLVLAPDDTPYLVYDHFDPVSNIIVRKWDGSSWQYVGGKGNFAGEGVAPDLAFSPDGTLYVAYIDYANEQKLSVKKWSGASWLPVGNGAVSSGAVEFPSLAFAPDGNLYVAFHDHANARKTTVLEWNGSNWQKLGSTGALSDGFDNFQSLAIAPDGTPYVAFQDGGHEGKTTVLKWNGSSWQALGGAGISNREATFQNIRIAPDGTLYVAYQNYHEGNIHVLKWVGSSWQQLGGEGFSIQQGYSPSLEVSLDGILFLAFSDWISETSAVAMWDGKQWKYLGSGSISPGQTSFIDLALTVDGAPYVAYTDYYHDTKETVKKYSQSNWITFTVTDKAGNSTNAVTVVNVTDATAPVVTSSHRFNIKENSATETVVGQITATDNCGSINWEITSGNSGSSFSIDGNGQITVADPFLLDYESNQEFILQAKASDPSNNSAPFEISIRLNNVNEAPVLMPFSAFYVNEKELMTFTVSATDVDTPADQLVYSLNENAPTGATIDAATGLFSWTPTEEQGSGLYRFNVFVSDGEFIIGQEVSIGVQEVNQPPVIISEPVTTARVGERYVYQVIAVDEDLPANRLTYFAQRLPSWLSFDAFTHTISGTPGPTDLLNNEVRLSVVDGYIAHVQKFIIEVEGPTGIKNENNDFSSQFMIVPNPSRGNVMIRLKGVDPGKEFAANLFTLEGKHALEIKGNLAQISKQISACLVGSKAGIYMLQLTSKDETSILRIIKQ